MRFNGADLDKEHLPSVQDYNDLIARDVVRLDCKTHEEFLALKEEMERKGFECVGSRGRDEKLYEKWLAEERSITDSLPLYNNARERYGFKASVDEAIFEYLLLGNEMIITPDFDDGKPSINSSSFFIREKDMGVKAISRQELLKKLEDAEKKAQENYDLYTQTYAEMKNVQKRKKIEMEDLSKYANASLIKDILPVIDNLERTFAHTKDDETPSGLVDGVKLTLEGLMSTLKKSGLEAVETEGKPFDPNFHEAVSMQADDNIAKDYILTELQKGYMLNGRLIRPSMVVVSKGKE